MIVVSCDFDIFRFLWMEKFLKAHSSDMLFLPKSVLVLSNSDLLDVREEFLHFLCTFYTKT